MENSSVCEWPEMILAFMSILSPILVGGIGYLFWLLQKNREPKYLVLKERAEQAMKAHMQCWALLKYLSKNENEKTILIRRKDEQGGLRYFLEKENAIEYEKKIAKLIYDEGYGLFLDKEIRDLLFESRNQLHRVLDTDREGKDSRIKIKNTHLVKRLHEIFDELNVSLKYYVNQKI